MRYFLKYIDQFQVRQVDLENQLGDIKKERDDLKAKYEKVGNDYETLRRTQTSKEEDAKKRHSRLEEKIRELETEKLRLTSGSSSMVNTMACNPNRPFGRL